VAGTAAGAGLFGSGLSLNLEATLAPRAVGSISAQSETNRPDYTLRIGAAPVEIAPKHIVSTITYSGQFPGPLLRFKEGESVTVEVHNDTDTPEQLHWHGQFVSPNVDGAAEVLIRARHLDRRRPVSCKPTVLR